MQITPWTYVHRNRTTSQPGDKSQEEDGRENTRGLDIEGEGE